MNELILNMPADEYRKADGEANSDLKEFARSPQHYLERKRNPSTPTPSMLFGTAYHKAVFEWPDFEANAVVMPEFSGKGSREAKREWLDQQAVRLVLSDDDHKTIVAMRKAILAHSMASRMIVAGKAEVSAFYDDPEFGLRRKCRADFLPDNSASIVDLKTTTDASADEFARTIYNFGYFQQAAYYLDILNAVEPSTPRRGFCFIAQEKEPPYAVACYFLEEEDIALGRTKYRKLLQRLAECQRDNKWPGYSDDLLPISLPKWARKKEESGSDVVYVLS